MTETENTKRLRRKGTLMLRKSFTTVLLFLLIISICFSIASCGPQETVSELSREEGSSVSERSESSSASEYSEIVIDPTESSAEESHGQEESGGESDGPVEYPDPRISDPYITAPGVKDDDRLPIRSISQGESGKIELFGGLRADDEEVASALAEIQSLLDAYDKKIGFCAYALDGSAAVAYNCEREFFSACTIKTGFILYCCLAIEQGLADKNEVMYYQEKYYHQGSGDIRLSPYGTPYTLETLIYKALNISDNVAYEMLTAYFGHDGYNRFIEEIGCSRLKLGSSIWSHKMTARDLCIIWREIYFYFQTETPMAQLYKKACTNTKFNYCALYLNLPYSHKSGDNFGKYPAYNDGAIIWAEKPYVVAFLTNSEGEALDEKTVNGISKLICDHIIGAASVDEDRKSKGE